VSGVWAYLKRSPYRNHPHVYDRAYGRNATSGLTGLFLVCLPTWGYLALALGMALWAALGDCK